MPGPDKKWDTAAERDLCVAVIAGNQDTERIRHNWPKIHEFMDTLGYTFTKEAISQHFTKVIMKDFKKRHEADGSIKLASKKPAASTKKTTAARPKKRVKPASDDDSDAEQKPKKIKVDDSESPVKSEDGRERSATVLDNEAAFRKWAGEE